MDAIVAVLTVVAAVAGIVQTIVTLVERSERKRLTQKGHSQLNYETASPTWRPALRSEKRADQGLVNRPVKTSIPTHYLHKETDEKNYGIQSLAGSPTSSGLDDSAANRQSSRAYFFGFIGGLIYRGSPSEKVRFHAAQSRWIDIFAVAYFVIALILTVIYLAIRYPGPGPQQVAPNDPVMWAWTLTSLLGPPIAHVALSILALLGKNPRIPLVWKIAATVSARQRKSLASDEERLSTQSPIGQELFSSERPGAESAREKITRRCRSSNYSSPEINGNKSDYDEQLAVQPLRQTPTFQSSTGEVHQPIDREIGWDFLRADRGNEKGSYGSVIK